MTRQEAGGDTDAELVEELELFSVRTSRARRHRAVPVLCCSEMRVSERYRDLPASHTTSRRESGQGRLRTRRAAGSQAGGQLWSELEGK